MSYPTPLHRPRFTVGLLALGSALVLDSALPWYPASVLVASVMMPGPPRRARVTWHAPGRGDRRRRTLTTVLIPRPDGEQSD